MVGVAQLVRAPDCGSGGRGFDSHHSPQFIVRKKREEAVTGFRFPTSDTDFYFYHCVQDRTESYSVIKPNRVE